MRATRAYIASAGTAAVMLGASLATFALVSAYVAFGSWPGGKSSTEVDQVVLRDAVKAKPRTVAVRADAVAVARRAEARQVAAARRQAQTRAVATLPAGTPVAQAPGTTAAPTTQPATAAAPTNATAPVQQQTQNVDKTVRQVGTRVQQQVQSVQNQVNEVVGQVIGGQQPDTGGTVQQVTDTAGSLLGH